MINLDPKVNPARFPALFHARERANRENIAMSIYVGPPECGGVMQSNQGCNVWFVRKHAEPAPEGAEFFQLVAPGDAGTKEYPEPDFKTFRAQRNAIFGDAVRESFKK